MGLGKFLELLFRLFVIGIDVRMVFARKFSERLADLLRGGVFLQTQNAVIVFLLCACHCSMVRKFLRLATLRYNSYALTCAGPEGRQSDSHAAALIFTFLHVSLLPCLKIVFFEQIPSSTNPPKNSRSFVLIRG